MNEDVKKQLAQTGIFTGAILLFFLVLSLFAALGKKSWERGLKAAVEQVLPEGEWQCGKFLKIDSNYSVSAACFELSKKNESKDYYAVIVRMTGYWGPAPAVFVCSEGEAQFMGVAFNNNSLSLSFESSRDDRQTSRWAKTAALIAQEAAAQKGAQR